MRVMRTPLTALLLSAALLFAGCGGDTSDTDAKRQPSKPKLPACGDVWHTGQNLPDPYKGCTDGGDKIAPKVHDCTSGAGHYVEGPDGMFAVEGGPIIDTVGELARICD